MAWAKIDDGFFRHSKARRAGKDGRALFLAGLCWCGAQRTDGYIDTTDLPIIAAEAEVRPSVTAARLVEIGLWEPVDGGWLVHDYLTYNPSSAAIEDRRNKRSDAGRKGGLKSRPPTKHEATVEPTTEANASPIEKQNGTPSPSPSPLDENPLVSTTVRDRTAGEPRRDRVEAAVTELAHRDLTRVTARGVAIAKPARYESACITARRRDNAPRLHELARQHPDWTEHQLADAIDHDTNTVTGATVTRLPDWQPTPVPDALDLADQADRARALRGQHDRAAR